MKNQLERIQELENQISKLPQGSITYKTIHGKKQPYLQWTENGKTRSKYAVLGCLRSAYLLALGSGVRHTSVHAPFSGFYIFILQYLPV